MTYRADPQLDARLAALVDGLPARPAPPLEALGTLLPYRTPRWVLVIVAVVLVLAAVVGFLLVSGRAADSYRVEVPAGVHPRMAAAQVAELARGELSHGDRFWPSEEPVPVIDLLWVVAGGRDGAVTWAVGACGPFVGMHHPPGMPDPYSSAGHFTVDDATGQIVGMGFNGDGDCPSLTRK